MVEMVGHFSRRVPVMHASHLGSLVSIVVLLSTPVRFEPGSIVGGPEHAGDAVTCDLPGVEHLANIGSRRDGRGMCVMTSIEMAARWHGLDQLRGLRDWCAGQPGGAYPAKVDRQLGEFCSARRISIPRYLQFQGRDPGSILDLCDRTGRMACITYNSSPRYPGPIVHMVCCVKYGDRWAVALDCNFPGDHCYEWMSRDELLRRMPLADAQAWIFVWLNPGPPPSPHS